MSFNLIGSEANRSAGGSGSRRSPKVFESRSLPLYVQVSQPFLLGVEDEMLEHIKARDGPLHRIQPNESIRVLHASFVPAR
jgi:hypothetical protein